MASCTSPRVSLRTLPISRVMSRANCSLRSAISWAARNSISARTGAGTRRQLFVGARRRLDRRFDITRASDSWNTPMRSSVFAGLRFSNVSPPPEGTQRPSMKLL